jgi:hypothetical protein
VLGSHHAIDGLRGLGGRIDTTSNMNFDHEEEDCLNQILAEEGNVDVDL